MLYDITGMSRVLRSVTSLAYVYVRLLRQYLTAFLCVRITLNTMEHHVARELNFLLLLASSN